VYIESFLEINLDRWNESETTIASNREWRASDIRVALWEKRLTVRVTRNV